MADEQHQYPVEAQLQWWRGPARIQGSYAVLDAARAERYIVGTFTGPEDDLAFDYAGITSPIELLDFIKRWGPPNEGPNSGLVTEDVGAVIGDAQHLRTIFEMYTDLLGFVTAGEGHVPSSKWAPVLKAMGWSGDPDPLSIAEVASSLVNDALGDTPLAIAVNPRFGDKGEAPFLASIGATTLRGYIYFHAATLLMASEPMRRCEECGKPFGVNHPRQRYCSERCGTRARQRRFAAKKEEQV